MDNIDAILKEVIIKNSLKDISAHEIGELTDLSQDFNFDSVMIVKMIVDLEEAFGITIDDLELDMDVLTKFSRLKELINQKMSLHD